MEKNPKVFISYSHDDTEHKLWVKELATQLRSHGVDIILDQWDLRLGNDLAFFMEQGLNKSQMVLCICSELYVKKANDRTGGTGYESTIITQPLLSKANSDHIICIVRNNPNKSIPTSLASKLYIDFSNDNDYFGCYQELLERIYDVDLTKKPELGENPFSQTNAQEILVQTELESIKYLKSNLSDIVTFNFTNNDGKFTIGCGSYEFVTSWSKASANSVYAYRDSVLKLGYIESNLEYPKKDDLDKFDYTSRARKINKNEVFLLMNRFGNFAAIKVVNVNDNLVTFEYKIYC
ncbi:MAG TPA: hypothetical protein DCE83_02750 [Enterococcus sp.]|nr:hypothetical protein [Enterococcus sp.]